MNTRFYPYRVDFGSLCEIFPAVPPVCGTGLTARSPKGLAEIKGASEPRSTGVRRIRPGFATESEWHEVENIPSGFKRTNSAIALLLKSLIACCKSPDLTLQARRDLIVGAPSAFAETLNRHSERYAIISDLNTHLYRTALIISLHAADDPAVPIRVLPVRYLAELLSTAVQSIFRNGGVLEHPTLERFRSEALADTNSAADESRDCLSSFVATIERFGQLVDSLNRQLPRRVRNHPESIQRIVSAVIAEAADERLSEVIARLIEDSARSYRYLNEKFGIASSPTRVKSDTGGMIRIAKKRNVVRSYPPPAFGVPFESAIDPAALLSHSALREKLRACCVHLRSILAATERSMALLHREPLTSGAQLGDCESVAQHP